MFDTANLSPSYPITVRFDVVSATGERVPVVATVRVSRLDDEATLAVLNRLTSGEPARDVIGPLVVGLGPDIRDESGIPLESIPANISRVLGVAGMSRAIAQAWIESLPKAAEGNSVPSPAPGPGAAATN